MGGAFHRRVHHRIAIAERRFTDAEKSVTEALTLFQNRARQPELSADVGESLLLLAQAQQGLGEFGPAADSARRAVASLAGGLGPDHPLTHQAALLASISAPGASPAQSPSDSSHRL